MIESQDRWDQDYLALARWWALRRSKDPSTKCGAVIVTPDNRPVSFGYNGLSRRVRDLPERYTDRAVKYKMIVHAEQNALTFAGRAADGCTLYTWPFMPCAACAAVVIQAGITRCVAPRIPEHLRERWEADMAFSLVMFREAGVKMDFVELQEE